MSVIIPDLEVIYPMLEFGYGRCYEHTPSSVAGIRKYGLLPLFAGGRQTEG